MTNQPSRNVRHIAVTLCATLAFTPATSRAQAEVPSVSKQASVRDIYDGHNKAAMSARAAGDWATVRRHAAAVDTLFNGNPSTLLAMARAHARLGDTAAALDIVRTVVAMGVSRNLSADKDLASLHSLPEWTALIAKNDANTGVVGEPTTVFALPALDDIVEDIAWDARSDRYLVSSVRKGTITSVKPNGMSTVFATREATGAWGLFALAVDSAKSRLWATTVAMPHVEGFVPADSGKSSVLRLDLSTGAVQKRYDLPPHARGNSLGDITLAPNGDLYVSDSRTGILYTIRSASDMLEVLVPEGTFMSPQTPALSVDGRVLYVADYIRGLASVELATGKVRWLRHPRDAALNGIDGLLMTGSNTLIAIQNGVMPNRVLALTVDQAAGAITTARVLAQNVATIHEPTHGIVRNGELHFIANAGWDVFGDDGAMLKDAKPTPTVVLSIKLQ